MSGIDEARALLPWWALWGPFVLTPLMTFLVGYLLTRGVLWVMAWPFRRSVGRPWYERARAAFPIAAAARVLLLGVPAGTVVALLPVYEFLAAGPVWLYLTLATFAAFAGTTLALRQASLAIRGGPPVAGDWGRTMVFTLGMNSPLLVLPAAAWMPDRFDAGFFVLYAPAAALGLYLAAGGGLRLVVWGGAARPAPEGLRTMVARVAAGHPARVRAVYVLDVPGANAFANLPLGVLMFSRELPGLLSERELEAFTAHELAHLTESWWTFAGRCVPVGSLLLLGLAARPIFAALGPAAIPLVATPLALGVASGFLSRKLERRADAAGRRQEAAEGDYARALEAIYRANLMPAVGPGRGSHPHLYDRLVAAGVQPDYKRPKPPSDALSMILLPVFAPLLLGAAFAGRLHLESVTEPGARAALFGTTDFDLVRHAWRCQQEGDLTAAATFYRAAAERFPNEADYPAHEAMALASLGRQAEARRALAEARARSRTAMIVRFAEDAVLRGEDE